MCDVCFYMKSNLVFDSIVNSRSFTVNSKLLESVILDIKLEILYKMHQSMWCYGRGLQTQAILTLEQRYFRNSINGHCWLLDSPLVGHAWLSESPPSSGSTTISNIVSYAHCQ